MRATSTASRSGRSRTATSRPSTALFERLGPCRARSGSAARSRGSRRGELALLARVDADRHALVGYVDGDPAPAALAQLVRVGAAAEIAFAVADEYQGRGIGSTLAQELAADAAAAQITELRVTVTGDNPRAVSLVRRIAGSLRERWLGGGQREFVLRLGR